MQDIPEVSAVNGQSSAPLVVIRTLPLAVGNYGGVLQAYALQEYLRRLGVDPVTDAPATFRFTTRTMARSAWSTLWGKRDEYLPPGIVNATNSRVHRFVLERIRTVEALEAGGARRLDVLNAASVAITGSDQVWRRAYGRVLPYLFADLHRPDLRLLSFAASFGRDDLTEYPPRLVRESARLARGFHAVSVREHSGVVLCREHWGVTAEQHLDPVFLLDGDHYRELAGHLPGGSKPQGEGGLLAYILDESPAKSALVADTAARLGLQRSSFEVPVVTGRRSYQARPAAYVRPALEEWLGSFVAADFVITDSFHGTALSILLNKPFIALVNQGRGAARFISILEIFGLESRLWATPDELLPDELLGPVDWQAVNSVAQRERARSGAYLTRNVIGASAVMSKV